MKQPMSLRDFVGRLKREPGVAAVYLVGSALSGEHPKDLDVVVNWLGVSGDELKLHEKYQDTLVSYEGKEILVDLHIHSTDVPEYEFLSEQYGTYRKL